MVSEWLSYQVFDLLTNGDILIGDGYRAKNEELSAQGIPFARAGNINGGFNFEGTDCFPKKDLYKLGNKISQPGDVVFTSKGTVGRFAFVTEDMQSFAYSPQLCFWRSLNRALIEPKYLYYWMTGPEFFHQYNSVKGQTDMADYVSLSNQRRMYITLPSIHEQNSIADILGSLDDKIELNRRTSATLKESARALFKSWFVDFDPVRAKMESRQPDGIDAETATLFPDRLVESELGLIPEGWEIKPLDEIADFLNGLPLQKYPAEDEKFLPAIKIRELRQGYADETSDRISPKIDPNYVINDGDVIFSWSGSLLVDIWSGGVGALNQHLFKVSSESYPKWFYYLWVVHHLQDFQRIAEGKATTMGHIQRHHLSAAKTFVPPELVLQAMSRIMEPILYEQLSRNLNSRTLVTTRDVLLPKLLSGKIQVLGEHLW